MGTEGYEKGIKFIISGNEVYNTNSVILPAKNMLRSKLHRQFFLFQFPFHFKSASERRANTSKYFKELYLTAKVRIWP